MSWNRAQGSAVSPINHIVIASFRRLARCSRLFALGIASLVMALCSAGATAATTTLPVLWTAGGLSAGNDSVGQAAAIASDASGNIAVVSGPAFARSLGVTSYTATGVPRWQQSVAPVSGTFVGSRVAAAPNGDFVATGANIDARGRIFGVTIVRYSTNGALLWRVDSTELVATMGRLVVDTAGNAYLGYNSILHKYSPSGTLLWATPTSVPDGAVALSPDGADVVVTGASGGIWRTASFNTVTGASRWLVNGAEGVQANDVVVDGQRVYVTGQGYTGASTPALAYFLTVVAYDRATGSRLWRTDTNAPTGTASARRIAQAPDGSLVVAGQTSAGGYFDWWIVALNNNGSIKWQTRRDMALSGDEIPASIFVRADGTTVVSGVGGPVTRDALGNAYLQGVTAGYDSAGLPQWEAFAKLPIAGATPLPNGDICAAGGYDALVTCWHLPGTANYQPVLTATPLSGSAPLTVNFNRAVTTDPNGPIIRTVVLTYGDSAAGITGTIDTGDGSSTYALNQNSSHTYNLPGTYTASLSVAYTDNTVVTKTAVINVSPNVNPPQPPQITASPAIGTAPLTVTFTHSATAGYGPLINSYSVNHGDGTSNLVFLNASVTSLSSTSTHTYTAVGTYTAMLTVNYVDGTSANGTTTVVVNPVVAIPVLRSTAINLSATLQRSRVNASADVVVGNGSGVAVSGAVVAATWTKPGGATVTQTATTGSTGVARFSTSGSRGTYTLTVTNIGKTGYNFDGANSVLSSSITR